MPNTASVPTSEYSQPTHAAWLERLAADPTTAPDMLTDLAMRHPELHDILAANPNLALHRVWAIAAQRPWAILTNPTLRFAAAAGEILHNTREGLPEGLLHALAFPQAPLPLLAYAFEHLQSSDDPLPLLANPNIPSPLLARLADPAWLDSHDISLSPWAYEALHHHVAFPGERALDFYHWQAPTRGRLLQAGGALRLLRDSVAADTVVAASLLGWLDLDAVRALPEAGFPQLAAAATLVHPDATWDATLRKLVPRAHRTLVDEVHARIGLTQQRLAARERLQRGYLLPTLTAVLLAVSSRLPYLPDDLLLRLTHHPFSGVRGMLAANPHTPHQVCLTLRDDADLRVRELANQAPSAA